MKYILLIALAIVAVQSFPQKDVQVVTYNSDNSGTGVYQFEYELSDKTFHKEEGRLDKAGSDDEALVVDGSYGYLSPEGKQVQVVYHGGAHGFQPKVTIQ